jgi:hypothetical protein
MNSVYNKRAKQGDQNIANRVQIRIRQRSLEPKVKPS